MMDLTLSLFDKNDYSLLLQYIWKCFLSFYIRPFRPRCQRASLRLDEFQSLSLSLIKLSLLNTTMSGRIEDGAKTFASGEGRK